MTSSQNAAATGSRVVSARRRIALAAALAGLLGLWPSAVRAQNLGTYFPSGVPGYDQEPGVTVSSRIRPGYETPGVRVGSFVIRPSLDESTGYNSFVNPVNGSGSWLLQTAPAISADSDWSRNSLGGAFSVTNNSFFSLPAQDYTDWTASLHGGYTIDGSDLTLSYSHASLHQLGTEVGAVLSATPIPFDVDSISSEYTYDLGRLKITPSVNLTALHFSSATLGTAIADQSYRDRTVLTGGVTARYSLSGRTDLVAVAEGIESHYVSPQQGAPSNNSKSFLVLGGINYQATGLWQLQLLVGVEVRSFAASQYQSEAAGVAQGSVIWTPTGLTTITGTLARTIEDPSTEGTAGYTFTNAMLVVDHEYLRDVFLQARVRFQAAQFLQGGGTQASVTLGGGVTRLLNRSTSVSAEFNYTMQTGEGTAAQSAPNLNAQASSAFDQGVFIIALHFAL